MDQAHHRHRITRLLRESIEETNPHLNLDPKGIEAVLLEAIERIEIGTMTEAEEMMMIEGVGKIEKERVGEGKVIEIERRIEREVGGKKTIGREGMAMIVIEIERGRGIGGETKTETGREIEGKIRRGVRDDED